MECHTRLALLAGRSLQPFRQRLGAFLDAWAQACFQQKGIKGIGVLSR